MMSFRFNGHLSRQGQQGDRSSGPLWNIGQSCVRRNCTEMSTPRGQSYVRGDRTILSAWMVQSWSLLRVLLQWHDTVAGRSNTKPPLRYHDHKTSALQSLQRPPHGAIRDPNSLSNPLLGGPGDAVPGVSEENKPNQQLTSGEGSGSEVDEVVENLEPPGG